MSDFIVYSLNLVFKHFCVVLDMLPCRVFRLFARAALTSRERLICIVEAVLVQVRKPGSHLEIWSVVYFQRSCFVLWVVLELLVKKLLVVVVVILGLGPAEFGYDRQGRLSVIAWHRLS